MSRVFFFQIIIINCQMIKTFFILSASRERLDRDYFLLKKKNYYYLSKKKNNIFDVFISVRGRHTGDTEVRPRRWTGED